MTLPSSDKCCALNKLVNKLSKFVVFFTKIFPFGLKSSWPFGTSL